VNGRALSVKPIDEHLRDKDLAKKDHLFATKIVGERSLH
jgi:hypothetical protein